MHRRKPPHKSGGSYGEVSAGSELLRAEPQRDPGAEPMVRGSGANPLEAEGIFCLSEVQMRRKFVDFWLSCNLLKYTF